MAQEEVLEEISGMGSKEVEGLRTEAKYDLYFLSKGILGYDQLRPLAHLPLCSFLTKCESLRRLILMSRGHLKSTIATIGDSVRLALINPNIRILIGSANATKAQGFLTEIKNHWEKEDSALCELFPELRPLKFSGPGSDWSMDSASLRRDSIFKESTWTAIGAGGAATSQHYNRLKLDDIIDEQHKQSNADMERVKIWNRSTEPLLDNLDVDTIDWIGTRKTVNDVYADIQAIWEGELATFHRDPIENGEVIFPLKFSMKRFEQMMKNTPEEWFHDYMNNPVGKGGTDWGDKLVQYYVMTENGDGVFFTDPVTKAIGRWKLSELDILITVDPNSGKPFAPDKAAVIVHGVSPRRQIFVLDAQSGRPSPDGLVTWIWDAAIKWKPRQIGIEEAGQQTTMFWFNKRCSDEGIYFFVVPVPHKNVDKEIRIRKALDTPLKARSLYLLPHMTALATQVRLFPQLAVHNWDEIDALSQGPFLYREGMTQEDKEVAEEAKAKVLAARGQTGYGGGWKRRR